MAEIKHNVLSDYLSSLKSDNSSGTNLQDSNNLNKIPPVFFIWGEEFLCRKVFDAVISFLLPGNLKELCYELLEGEDAAIPAMMERICTYSFFQQIKVVAIKNAPIFSSSGTASSTGFLQSDLESLQSLIEKGFPENHYLVITSSNADKRRTLFTAIKNTGVAIDCTVSQGSTKTDKEQQSELLRLTMIDVLDRTGKGIDGDAFQALTEMTGFDPAAFNDNLERLTSFIGDREKITIKDVYSVVKRSKKEPIFELTNAVSQKNLESSLFYYKSLCDNGFHPLQLLASIVNQMRKIFVVKSFIAVESQRGNACWRSGNQSYQQFNAGTMPYIIKFDAETEKTMSQWNEELKSSENNSSAKSGPAKNSTDLMIASNPKSAYPVYQTFLKADKFRLDELISIMCELSEIDYRFKSSSDSDPFILLEQMIIKICINSFQKKI